MSTPSIQKRYANKTINLDVCPQFIRQLKLRELQGAQKSEEWLQQRDRMITASDAAAALGENPYSTQSEFVERKCSNTCGSFTGNSATLWGEQWEDVALQKYCDSFHKDVYALNLVQHSSIPWLGGSPDGVTEDGILIEIKCPPHRKIKPGVAGVPRYYIHQVQMLMEVCDLNSCHFVQYKPYMGEFAAEQFEVAIIPRDPNWMQVNMTKLSSVWKTISDRRALINDVETTTTDTNVPTQPQNYTAVPSNAPFKRTKTIRPSLHDTPPICMVMEEEP